MSQYGRPVGSILGADTQSDVSLLNENRKVDGSIPSLTNKFPRRNKESSSLLNSRLTLRLTGVALAPISLH
jgi:hypothetical protein